MSKKSFKYSEAVSQLNDILADLQEEGVDIDQVAGKVRRAVELIRLCKDRIQSTEMEVKQIVKEFEEEFSPKED